MTRSLHLVTTVSSGRDKSANTWTLPEAPRTLAQRLAQNLETIRIAEAGKLDAVLYADIMFSADPQYWRPTPSVPFEALTLLSALAATSSKIGLVPSLSTTFDIPFQVARRVLSLDHLSGGRAGWNIVANFSEDLARAITPDGLPRHADRYRRAHEFTEVVKQLWDGFEDGASVLDVASQTFTDPEKIHPTEFKGEFFDVKGLLGSPRSEQGQPVIFQAGSSSDGIEFAAKHAEVVFTSQKGLDKSKLFRRQLADRARTHQRSAPIVLPGLTFVIGSTEEEARRTERRYLDAVIADAWLKNGSYLKTYFKPEDAAKLGADLDAPLPPFLDETEGYQTAFRVARQQVGERQITVRDFLDLTVRGEQFAYWVGAPEQIADQIEHWFQAEAADGFIFVEFHDINGQLKLFTEQVVPILQKRGLFRTEYEGSTLRDHLGLARPRNRFV